MTGKLLAGFILAMLLPGSASAVLVTWVFEGQVGAIQEASPATLATLSSLGVAEGSAFSGQLVFESSTPYSDFSSAEYPGAIQTFELTIGSYQASMALATSTNRITVYNNSGGSAQLTALALPAGEYHLLTAPVLYLYMESDDFSFPSEELPLSPPDLASFGTYMQVFGNDGYFYLELTSLEVPEPTMLALVAPFVLAVLFRRR